MSNEIVKSNEYLQMMPISQAKDWYQEFVEFSKSILKKDLDFGEIPGTNKPTLYKAGAEKLRFVYGFGVEMTLVKEVMDLDRPFIKYTYRATIVSKSGQKLAECDGSCNSLEPKFGYLWKTKEELPVGFDVTGLPTKTSGKNLSEFDFAINKAETTGAYGKPAEYWQKFKDAIASGKAKKVNKKSKAGKEMVAYELNEAATVYRILNPDVIGVDNTLMKMAQKRAFVGATLLATGASEFFTQDIEDMEIDGKFYSEQSGFEDIAHEEIKIKVPTEPGKTSIQDLHAVAVGSEKYNEELASAIEALNIATSKADLNALKKQLPAYIVLDASFIAAGKKRYEVIMAEGAK